MSEDEAQIAVATWEFPPFTVKAKQVTRRSQRYAPLSLKVGEWYLLATLHEKGDGWTGDITVTIDDLSVWPAAYAAWLAKRQASRSSFSEGH